MLNYVYHIRHMFNIDTRNVISETENFIHLRKNPYYLN